MSASAQNIRQDNIAFSRSGLPAPGALIAVCSQPASQGATNLLPCSPRAPLCSSATDLTCSSPNPVTADGLGNYHFYVKPGTYAIQIYGSGLTSTLLPDQTVGGSGSSSAGAATTEAIPNCAVTGTTLNQTVQLSSQQVMGVTQACATLGGLSSTSVIGICNSGCGTSGTAQVAYQAFQACIFDNQTVINDVALPSTSVAGDCTDGGASPATGQKLGHVASLNTGAGTQASVNMFTGDILSVGAGLVNSVFGRNGTVTAQANDYNWSQTAAGSNLNPQTMGTGGSLSPVNLGQNADTQAWWGPGFNALTLATNVSGGTLLINHTIHVRYTLISAAGETLANGDTTISTPGACGGGNNQCQVVVTAPFIPAGFTGYTVYSYDSSAGGTQPLKQTANNACVNITTSCTINAVGIGANLPTANTAYLQPPGALGTNTCSPNTLPFLFTSDQTPTFYGYAGVDSVNTGANPPAPYNKLSFCRPVWINDTATDPPNGRNSLFLVYHLQNGAVTNINNQDRGQFIFTTNCVPTPGCADSATHYALEGIQVEQDINGTPTRNGNPDGEFTAGSFQIGFSATSVTEGGSGFGTNAIRATFFRQAGAGADPVGMNAITAAFTNGSTVSAGGAVASAVQTLCGNTAVSAAALCANIFMQPPPATAFDFSSGYLGIFQKVNVNFAPALKDQLIRNDIYNFLSVLGGPVYLTQLQPSNAAPVNTSGDFSIGGSTTTAQQSGVSSTVPTCSGGASVYSYKWVGVDTNGGTIAGSVMSTAAACTNPLTVGNPTTFANSPVLGQFVRFDLYRTAGPMATGKIGCLGLTGSGCTWLWPNGVYNPQAGLIVGSAPTVADTGLAADGGTVPAPNTTGGISTPGISHLAANILQVASNFTTANNANLQTITGLSFNVSTAAVNYSFHCALSYSQATANVAVAFGIQAATVAPTNIFANGTQQITVGPPATIVTGTLATLNTTTATNIVSGTPGALATNYTAQLDGTIEQPANSSGNAINFMVSTAAGGDAVTVLRGSYCQIY